MLKEYLSKTKLIGILVLAFLVRIYIFSRGKTDATALDIYNIIQIGVTTILATVIIIRKDFLIVWKLLLRSPLGSIILLYIFGFVSGIWSVLPVFSSYFGLEGLVYIFAVGLILLNQISIRHAEELLIYSSLVFIMLIIAGISRHNGISLNLFSWHTNTYSVIAAMLSSYCLGELSNQNRRTNNSERKLLKKGLYFGVLFLFLGTSSASNIAAVVGFVTVVLISGKPVFKALSIFLLCAIILLNYFYADLIFSLIFPGKTFDSVEMMSGRINLWSSYIDNILEKPYLGWGFAAFSRIQGLYNIHTHNSFLEVFGGVGLVGLFLYFIFILRILRKFIKWLRYPYIQGVVAATTTGLVNSNAISIIGNPTGILFISFIAWNIFGIYYILEIKYFDYRKSIKHNMGNPQLSRLPDPGI